MVVIIDCNIWITLSINDQIDFIADISDNGIIIATCEILRDEIINVLHRPKLSKYIPQNIIPKVMKLHDLVTVNYSLRKISLVVADVKDNYLFALADKAKADYLITGDKLLLQVINYKKTQVITLANFKEIIK